MQPGIARIDTYLEIGQKRAFASALHWPGWSRSGQDESTALRALLEYGTRYARALGGAPVDFRAPADLSALVVVERLEGGASTDFGVPSLPSSGDARPMDDAELARANTLLKAFWATFDAISQAARGKELRRGPRGGGRDLDKIVRHVLEADAAYLVALGWRPAPRQGDHPEQELGRIRQAIQEALVAAAHGELAPRGPRGGVRWSPRYFVRRTAWHLLDHAWEIEDRAGKP